MQFVLALAQLLVEVALIEALVHHIAGQAPPIEVAPPPIEVAPLIVAPLTEDLVGVAPVIEVLEVNHR